MQLPEIVNALAGDGEEEPRLPQAGAFAVGTRALDHYFVEPFLHPRAGFAPLAIPPVIALDTPGDALKADVLALMLVELHLRVGWGHEPNPGW